MTPRPRARPRFTLDLPITPDAVTERVRVHLERCGGKVTGSVFRRTIMLTVCKEETHFWSPHLDVQLEETSIGGTRVAAMFSPHPHVWTAFLGVQLAFGLLSLVAAMWVLSVWLLGQRDWWALGVLGLMLFGGGFSYGAAYVGQGIGSEQMYELRAFLEEALREEHAGEPEFQI